MSSESRPSSGGLRFMRSNSGSVTDYGDFFINTLPKMYEKVPSELMKNSEPPLVSDSYM